jgi:hypothetical protein
VLEVVDTDTPSLDIKKVTPFLLKSMCMAISQAFFEICFFPKGRPASFDYMKVNLTEKSPVPVGTFPAGCKLPLAGDITCSRQKGSIICSAIQVRINGDDDDNSKARFFPIGFYICGDAYKNVLSEVFVPGWLAKAASGSQEHPGIIQIV